MRLSENKLRRIVRKEIGRVLNEASEEDKEKYKHSLDKLIKRAGVSSASKRGPGRWEIDGGKYYIEAQGMRTVVYDDQKWQIAEISDTSIVPEVVYGLANY